MPRPASTHAHCVWGHLARVGSAPLAPWCAKVPRKSRHMLVLLVPPVSHTISTSEALVHADACTSISSCLVHWGYLPLTASTQKGFGMPRCIERSRNMLVLLGAPFSHTVSTSEALVRENGSISFGSCPVLIGHLLRKSIGDSRALVNYDGSSSLGSCVCCWGHLACTASAPIRPWCAK